MVERILNIEQEEIDRRATRKRVESVLEAVRMYRAMGDLRKENEAAISAKNEWFKVAEHTVAYQAGSDEHMRGICDEVVQHISAGRAGTGNYSGTLFKKGQYVRFSAVS